MKRWNLLVIIGLTIVIMGILFGITYGSEDKGERGDLRTHTNLTITYDNNMTLDCVRLFYSDDWDKGYIIDLAKFCNGG